MAWLNADHGIILSSFVFVYKHKLTTNDGRCRGLTKAKGLVLILAMLLIYLRDSLRGVGGSGAEPPLYYVGILM